MPDLRLADFGLPLDLRPLMAIIEAGLIVSDHHLYRLIVRTVEQQHPDLAEIEVTEVADLVIAAAHMDDRLLALLPPEDTSMAPD